MNNHLDEIEESKKNHDKDNKLKRSQREDSKEVESVRTMSEPDPDIISNSELLISIDMRSDTSKASKSSSQRKRKSKNSIEHIVAYSSSKGITVPCL